MANFYQANKPKPDDLPPQPVQEHAYEIKPVEAPRCDYTQVGDYIHCRTFGHHHGAHVPGKRLDTREGKQMLTNL